MNWLQRYKQIMLYGYWNWNKTSEPWNCEKAEIDTTPEHIPHTFTKIMNGGKCIGSITNYLPISQEFEEWEEENLYIIDDIKGKDDDK